MNPGYRILLVEDDETVREVLATFLTKRGFEVLLAANGEAGLNMVRSEKIDLVMTDLIMPGISGMDVLKEVMTATPNVPVLVMTAFGTVQTAVEAMRIGAFDYLTKPFNLDELMVVLEKAFSISRLRKENIMLRMQLRSKYDFKELIGDAQPMQAVYQLIEKIADTDSTVLITGESGTGKELIAKTIHYNNSARAAGPFVPLNCAAIPKDLLESELFGHEKGAFTGAINSRMGRFELAQGGTLFIDEIADLDLSLQVKLLRVLQEREFERVGGVKTIKVDVRILAATNKNLDIATRDAFFREDLFYRLNVIPLHLPPLRERVEDIPLLIAHFIEKYCRKRNRQPFTIAAPAMERLLQYGWPGNVRELENLIERLSILLTDSVVQVADLPEKLRQSLSGASEAEHAPSAPGNGNGSGSISSSSSEIEIGEDGIDLNGVLSGMERQLIRKALDRTNGVRSRAAQLLGLNRTTLLEKMKKMGISAPKQ